MRRTIVGLTVFSYLFVIAFYCALVGGIGYVAWHFAKKFW